MRVRQVLGDEIWKRGEICIFISLKNCEGNSAILAKPEAMHSANNLLKIIIIKKGKIKK